MTNEKMQFLQNCKLFNGITKKNLTKLSELIDEITLSSGEILIEEGDLSQDLYIIKSGMVKIVRSDPHLDISHEMTTLVQGEIIGEMALIDSEPRSAHVIADTDCILYRFKQSDFLALSAKKLKSNPDTLANTALFEKIFANISKISIQRIRKNNNIIIDALSKKYELTRARLSSSILIVNIIILMSIYIIALQIKNYYSAKINFPTEYISDSLVLVFAIGVYLILKNSDRSFAFFGITLNNWKQAILESMALTIVMMLAVIFYVWLTDPQFALIHFIIPQEGKFNYPLIFPIIYIVSVLVQEIVTRGMMQTMFTELLDSKYKILKAIFLSNILFAIIHVHISPRLSLVVLVMGLLWGWLYSRHHTLIGVITSHLILGLWFLYIVRFP